jgi:isopentenyl-diphosphate delta-isomerase
MENVIWIDEDDMILGTVDRDEAHAKGIWHRLAVILVVNDRGQVLLQQRQSGKLDHSAAGHVAVGESYEDAARRELLEELGLSIPLIDLGSINEDIVKPDTRHNRHIARVYLCRAKDIQPDPKEVRGVFWADPRDVLRDARNDPAHEKYSGGVDEALALLVRHLDAA